MFVAQPPLYRIKKGKSEKYIKDDKEFTREILRRATDNVAVELSDQTKLEGGELRSFLCQDRGEATPWSETTTRLLELASRFPALDGRS